MKRVCIIAWEKDKAGMNIVEKLSSLVDMEVEKYNLRIGNTEVKKRYVGNSVDIFIVDTDTVFLEDIDPLISEYELIIFASRHESRSRRPMLSIHVPGNLSDEAKLGGKPWRVCYAHGAYMMSVFKIMYSEYLSSRLSEMRWDCCYEATHHGPYIRERPVFYIEIGSSESEWVNQEASEIISYALVKGLAKDVDNVSFVGISGLHYASVLSRKCFERDIPLGHIIPRYIFEELKTKDRIKRVLDEVVKKSIGFSGFVLEKKALKAREKRILIEILEENYREMLTIRV
ncbi:MAG: hypothetical protein DRZ82_00715 [Thermoprotei archaeon]|nr:MAG: hypothetical protein DRZ82_00715 [Thermoprotei archaeon]